MITSRDIISEAQRRYRLGLIDDETFLRVVDPVASGNAAFLLRLLKRGRRPGHDVDVIEAEYRVVDLDALPE